MARLSLLLLFVCFSGLVAAFDEDTNVVDGDSELMDLMEEQNGQLTSSISSTVVDEDDEENDNSSSSEESDLPEMNVSDPDVDEDLDETGEDDLMVTAQASADEGSDVSCTAECSELAKRNAKTREVIIAEKGLIDEVMKSLGELRHKKDDEAETAQADVQVELERDHNEIGTVRNLMRKLEDKLNKALYEQELKLLRLYNQCRAQCRSTRRSNANYLLSLDSQRRASESKLNNLFQLYQKSVGYYHGEYQNYVAFKKAIDQGNAMRRQELTVLGLLKKQLEQFSAGDNNSKRSKTTADIQEGDATTDDDFELDDDQKSRLSGITSESGHMPDLLDLALILGKDRPQVTEIRTLLNQLEKNIQNEIQAETAKIVKKYEELREVYKKMEALHVESQAAQKDYNLRALAVKTQQKKLDAITSRCNSLDAIKLLDQAEERKPTAAPKPIAAHKDKKHAEIVGVKKPSAAASKKKTVVVPHTPLKPTAWEIAAKLKAEAEHKALLAKEKAEEDKLQKAMESGIRANRQLDDASALVKNPPAENKQDLPTPPSA